MRKTTKLTRASLHVVGAPDGLGDDTFSVGDRLPLATSTAFGRDATKNDYQLFTDDIPPEAFTVQVEGKDFTVTPLNPDCPIEVNGARIESSTVIKEDDVISVGSFLLKFAIGF